MFLFNRLSKSKYLQRCGKCYCSCTKKCIQCSQCNKRYHERCTKLPKNSISEINNGRKLFVCNNKCFNSVLPFASINDRDFLKTNTEKIKNPCRKCTSACFVNSLESLRCKMCSSWYHLKCINSNKRDSGIISWESYDQFCSRKCEMKILPFNLIKNEDEDVFEIGDHFLNTILTPPTKSFAENVNSIEPDTDDVIDKCRYIDQSNLCEIMGGENELADLSVFHGNVVSLKKNINRVEDLFIDCEKMPDVLGISETRIDDDSYLVKLQGYEFVSCDSPTAAGGVGIYIREDLNYDVRDDLKLDVESCEDKWVEIILDSSNANQKRTETFIVGIVYRHPGNNFKTFQEKLSNTIYDLNHSNKNFMILGDVNINSMKYNLTTNITNYLNAVQSAGCISYIDQPTRVCKKGNRWESSCLDHVYSNLSTDIIDSYIIESGISDHFSTLTKVKGVKHVDINKIQIYKRKQKLNEEEIENLNAELKEAIHHYNRIRNTIPVNEKSEYIAKTLNILGNKYMPWKKLSRKEKNTI